MKRRKFIRPPKSSGDVDELLAMKSIFIDCDRDAKTKHIFPFAKKCWMPAVTWFVDKPFTTTLAKRARLVEIARRNDRVLTVYQERRCDGDFRTVQELLAKGTLGKIVRFESAFDRCRPQVRTESWKRGAQAWQRSVF